MASRVCFGKIVGGRVETGGFAPGWITYGNPLARFSKVLDAEGRKLSPASFVSAVHLGRAPILWDIDSITQGSGREFLDLLLHLLPHMAVEGELEPAKGAFERRSLGQ